MSAGHVFLQGPSLNQETENIIDLLTQNPPASSMRFISRILLFLVFWEIEKRYFVKAWPVIFFD